jgi:hypothetical protein
MTTAFLKSTVALRSGLKFYLEAHRSHVSIARTVLVIKDVLNVSDTNMAADKYSTLYINLFVILIYNMG